MDTIVNTVARKRIGGVRHIDVEITRSDIDV